METNSESMSQKLQAEFIRDAEASVENKKRLNPQYVDPDSQTDVVVRFMMYEGKCIAFFLATKPHSYSDWQIEHTRTHDKGMVDGKYVITLDRRSWTHDDKMYWSDDAIMTKGRLATPDEYKSLKDEMTRSKFCVIVKQTGALAPKQLPAEYGGKRSFEDAKITVMEFLDDFYDDSKDNFNQAFSNLERRLQVYFEYLPRDTENEDKDEKKKQ